MRHPLCLLRLHKWYVARVQTFRHFSGGLVRLRCERCPVIRTEYRR